MFVQITYNSRAQTRITEQVVADVLKRSVPNNLKYGLTGFMYYDSWRFLHVLEGRSAQVASAMKRITADPVHHSVQVRLMNRDLKCGFQGWPMGVMAASDNELRRVLKNMGYKDLFDANVLDVIKIMMRVAGRKYRMMNALEKQNLSDPSKIICPEPPVSLAEDILGLRR